MQYMPKAAWHTQAIVSVLPISLVYFLMLTVSPVHRMGVISPTSPTISPWLLTSTSSNVCEYSVVA